ncbi:MAG: lysophospholipid acyltransferase family protein [Brumimicrobium sp.]|nr:lysophospholipid acyltransferase family protein [Brumimicrobium sp.]
MRKLNLWILKLFGWDIDKESPQGVKKAIIAVGPHTSNYDFIIGKMAFNAYGVKARFLIKSELFFPPLGWLLKAMGGIPVKRGKNNNFTDQAIKYFEDNDTMFMVFTPEGTRSYNPNWKRGFYYIAIKAKVPIYLAYIDYANKTGGFLELFEPSGDIEKDLAYIKNKLSKYKGRFPENGIRSVEEE